MGKTHQLRRVNNLIAWKKAALLLRRIRKQHKLVSTDLSSRVKSNVNALPFEAVF